SASKLAAYIGIGRLIARVHVLNAALIFYTFPPKNLNALHAVSGYPVPSPKMSLPPARLTAAQKKSYDEQGYLLGLPPIFTQEEMVRINAELPNLLALLKPGE